MECFLTWCKSCMQLKFLKFRMFSCLDHHSLHPVLALPTGDGGFVVYTDALGQRLGCVLMQNGKVIIFTSKKLQLMKLTTLPMI